MSWDKKSQMIALIAGEFVFAIVLSLIFFKVVFTNEDFFFGNSYASGIFGFYGSLSIIFFVAVFSVGIFGAIKLRQSNRILKAVSYSFLFWFLSLILYVITFGFFSYNLYFRLIPLYIILVGIITGFNLGLKLKSITKSNIL